MFSAKKVLQEIAYLLKLNSKRMPLIKLMKELYLIDRLSIDERETSISGDSFFCMAHGPVLSFTLKLTFSAHFSQFLHLSQSLYIPECRRY